MELLRQLVKSLETLIFQKEQLVILYTTRFIEALLSIQNEFIIKEDVRKPATKKVV